jgi:nicotinate phosphoribosyltransferase
LPWVTDENAAMLTDMYELTMAASYFAHDMRGAATFDLFVRHLPAGRSFLVAAGADDALHYLETLRFDQEAIRYLRSLRVFNEPFLDFLVDLRFTGEVWAVPEGEVVFGEEPLLRVTAPLIEAQVVETFLLNCVNFQTLIATKAARIAIACRERSFVDFSPRRDHGADAALKAARAAYIGGAAATSNVLAGSVYGIPLSGTMAHSYVMSFEHESDAFRTYARDFPNSAVLLIDTYDTVEGARRVVQVARELAGEGIAIRAVRLDSGDIADLAGQVRRVLDDGGLAGTQIFASGDLDEFRIAEILATGAPIDAFGVGTQLGTSADAPALGGVYKLVDDDRGPKIKLSTGKATLPGKKQVYRVSVDGANHHDVIALDGEEIAYGPSEMGRPLLAPIMRDGRRLQPREPLDVIRARCREAIAALPQRLREFHGHIEPFPVLRSPGLERAIRDAGERARR